MKTFGGSESREIDSLSLAPGVREEAAWVEHADRLRRLALALTGNRADADDLVQQTILNLLDRRPERAGDADYARRALLNAWLDSRRGLRRRIARGGRPRRGYSAVTLACASDSTRSSARTG